MRSRDNGDRFKCDYCGRMFDDGRKKGGHVARAHREEMLESKMKMKNVKNMKKEEE